MHGLGNDFMVIDAIRQTVALSSQEIISLARRDIGVGFDQCLIIERSHQDHIDFFYRIYNADGQEVGQCGNGARCVARFIEHYGLSNKKTVVVATKTTKLRLSMNSDKTVTVEMNQPELRPAEIPLNIQDQAELYFLPLSAKGCHVHAIQVGNPHAVVVVSDVTTAPVVSLGKQISEHPLFPLQTNAGFMQIMNPHHVRLRVYERGCGETQACGSGAVAAAAIGRLYHQLADEVTVSLPGGDLCVRWPSLEGPIFLTGPAAFVYEGHLL